MTPIIDSVYDVLSFVVIVLAGLITIGVLWMWRLYGSADNPVPRSRFLLVLCIKSTIVMIAVWPLTWLAIYRLDPNNPSLGIVGGMILVVVILILMIAPLITIGYLFFLRRLRKSRGQSSPPPFQAGD